MILDAQWAVNDYTVKFNANGGNGTMADQEFTYDESQSLTENAFTKTGCTFTGWNTKADGTGTAYADGAAVKNLTTSDEITLYAQWSTNTYTVTFDTGRGSSVAQQTVDYGTTVTKPDDPTLTGYTFGNWYSDADRTQTFDFSAAITEDTTLYAKWNANKYTVKFDANADGATGTMADQAFTYNVKQALTENAFTRTGYTFLEWNTAADGSGRSYGEVAEVSNLATGGTVTLYAQWEPNTYFVEFASDFTLEEPVEGLMDGQWFTYDEEQALLKNKFTREGYEFIGWNTEEDGSGTMYADEATVMNLTAEPSGYVGLWAQWKHVHNWGAWTKLDDEQHQRVCANDSEHVEKQNHEWDAGKVTKEPTEAAEGEKTYTCTICGATKTESIPKKEVKPEPTPTPEPGSDPSPSLGPAAISYRNTDGDGNVWTKGSGVTSNFTFKRSDNDAETFEHFVGIEVDGVAVPEKNASGSANYTAESGSVIVSLQPSYLETLSEGNHAIKALFNDGDAEAAFSVVAKATPSGGEPASDPDAIKPSPDQARPSSDSNTPASGATKPASSAKATPGTGDTLMLLEIFGVVAAAIAAGLTVISKRRI